MEETKKKYIIAPFLSRFVAAIIDFGIVVILSQLSSTLIFQGLKKSEKTQLNATIVLRDQHISSSHLANYKSGNYISYTSDQYFEKTDNGYRIIDALSYFYLVYSTGDSEHATAGDIVSPVAEEEITFNNVKTTPKELYTVSWFNENVLNLPKEGQEAKYDYFVYQKTGENENDCSKVGTVNDKYIVDGEVNAPEEMLQMIYDDYKQAVTALYEQSNIIEYTDIINKTNRVVTFIPRISFVTIFLIVIPLILRQGKTIGKLAMRLSLLRKDGDPIKRWQVLPRSITFLVVPLFLFLFNQFLVQILSVGALVIASLILYLVNKENRMTLHDLIAQTVVVEDTVKTPQKQPEKVIIR